MSFNDLLDVLAQRCSALTEINFVLSFLVKGMSICDGVSSFPVTMDSDLAIRISASSSTEI